MEKLDRERSVRRAVLRVLKNYYPAPADIDDIERDQEIKPLYASRAEIVTELNALTMGKYITDVSGFNGRMKVIAERGMKQITQEAELEIFIWDRFGRV